MSEPRYPTRISDPDETARIPKDALDGLRDADQTRDSGRSGGSGSLPDGTRNGIGPSGPSAPGRPGAAGAAGVPSSPGVPAAGSSRASRSGSPSGAGAPSGSRPDGSP